MPYLYLVSSVFLNASTSIICAFYNRKNKEKQNASSFYNLLLLSSVFACWLILFSFDRSVDLKVIPYALLFSVGYISAMVGLVYALKTGPVLLTSLILQLSLIGTTVWGFFFWNSKFTLTVGIGLALVAVSLWLCLYTGKKEEGKLNHKWLFWVLILFLGNSCCTIVQKTQQMDFDGQYGNFMMMVATGIGVIATAFLYFKGDRSQEKTLLKQAWYFPVLAGALNAAQNLLVIVLATTSLSSSLIYPVLSIGSLMVVTLFSAFVFKEKLQWWQWLGIGVGTVAIAMLA